MMDLNHITSLPPFRYCISVLSSLHGLMQISYRESFMNKYVNLIMHYDYADNAHEYCQHFLTTLQYLVMEIVPLYGWKS